MKKILSAIMLLVIMIVPVLLFSQTTVEVKFREFILGKSDYNTAVKVIEKGIKDKKYDEDVEYLQGYWFNSKDFTSSYGSYLKGDRDINYDTENRIKSIRCNLNIYNYNCYLILTFYKNTLIRIMIYLDSENKRSDLIYLVKLGLNSHYGNYEEITDNIYGWVKYDDDKYSIKLTADLNNQIYLKYEIETDLYKEFESYQDGLESKRQADIDNYLKQKAKEEGFN